MVTVLATTVPCSMKITSFEYIGKARRKALGRTMRRMRWPGDMPQALAASISPQGVDSMTPRNISVV